MSALSESHAKPLQRDSWESLSPALCAIVSVRGVRLYFGRYRAIPGARGTIGSFWQLPRGSAVTDYPRQRSLSAVG